MVLYKSELEIGNGQHGEPALCQLYRHTFVPCLFCCLLSVYSACRQAYSWSNRDHRNAKQLPRRHSLAAKVVRIAIVITAAQTGLRRSRWPGEQITKAPGGSEWRGDLGGFGSAARPSRSQHGAAAGNSAQCSQPCHSHSSRLRRVLGADFGNVQSAASPQFC